MFNFLLDLIFPKFCCGCGSLGTFLCPHCFKQLEFFKHPVKIAVESPSCDQLWAMAKYQPPIDKLIFEMKYQSVKAIAIICGRMLFHCAKIPKVDAITFVPLHPKKEFQRGFNQSQVIATELGRLTQLPVFPLLKKIKNNKSQVAIDQKNQRLINPLGVYQITDSLPESINEINSCLIIDDVSTTGATINECAKILKSMGISQVYGLTVAHG